LLRDGRGSDGAQGAIDLFGGGEFLLRQLAIGPERQLPDAPALVGYQDGLAGPLARRLSGGTQRRLVVGRLAETVRIVSSVDVVQGGTTHLWLLGSVDNRARANG